MEGVGHALRPDADCSASNACSRARARRRLGVTATAPSASEARIARFTPAMVSERWPVAEPEHVRLAGISPTHMGSAKIKIILLEGFGGRRRDVRGSR